MKAFYLTLPSNSSTADYYPQNKTGNYQVKLPQHIELDGRWEVGLCEFHFPLNFIDPPPQHEPLPGTASYLRQLNRRRRYSTYAGEGDLMTDDEVYESWRDFNRGKIRGLDDHFPRERAKQLEAERGEANPEKYTDEYILENWKKKLSGERVTLPFAFPVKTAERLKHHEDEQGRLRAAQAADDLRRENDRKIADKTRKDAEKKAKADAAEKTKKAKADAAEKARKARADAAEKDRKAKEDAAEKDRKVKEDAAEKDRKAKADVTEKARQAKEDAAEKDRKVKEDAAEEKPAEPLASSNQPSLAPTPAATAAQTEPIHPVETSKQPPAVPIPSASITQAEPVPQEESESISAPLVVLSQTAELRPSVPTDVERTPAEDGQPPTHSQATDFEPTEAEENLHIPAHPAIPLSTSRDAEQRKTNPAQVQHTLPPPDEFPAKVANPAGAARAPAHQAENQTQTRDARREEVLRNQRPAENQEAQERRPVNGTKRAGPVGTEDPESKRATAEQFTANPVIENQLLQIDQKVAGVAESNLQLSERFRTMEYAQTRNTHSLTQMQIKQDEDVLRTNAEIEHVGNEVNRAKEEMLQKIGHVAEETAQNLDKVTVFFKSHHDEIDVAFAKPHYLYIYCDLVEPQIVGSVKAPLLRIVKVPTFNALGSSAVVTFENPYYLPVQRRHFDSVHIDITDHSGRSSPFINGISIATLHFRKIK